MKARQMIICFGLLIWLVGCSPTLASKAVTPASKKTMLATVTPISVETPMQTRTSTPAKVTSTAPTTLTLFHPTSIVVTEVASPISPEVWQFHPLEIVEPFPKDSALTGTIILIGRFYWDNKPPEEDLKTDSYFLNLGSGEKLIFWPADDQSSYWGFDVSPDGKSLVYVVDYPDSPTELVITAAKKIYTKNEIYTMAKNEIYLSIPWKQAYRGLGWLNSELLMISRDIDVGIADHERGQAGKWSLVLLNPFTGWRQEILPYFPNLWSPDPGYLYMHYDPTLTRMVYPSGDSDCPFVLWNVQTEEKITCIPGGDQHQWSPDGAQLAWLKDVGRDEIREPYYWAQEFFVVSRDGQISQLTHLTDHFHNVAIASYSWSPDGRHIAFWLNTERGSPFHLAVLDTQTGQVTDYGIRADFEEGAWYPNYLNYTDDSAPIWSPDGQQLLIVTRDPKDEERRLVIIVDIVQSFATTVVENMIPVGWMVAP